MTVSRGLSFLINECLQFKMIMSHALAAQTKKITQVDLKCFKQALATNH